MLPRLFEVERTGKNRREKILENLAQRTLALAVKAVLPVVAGSVGGFVALTYPAIFHTFCNIGG